MQRRRSVSHTFEENIAAEKAKLEAQVAKLKPGPQRDALLRKIRQLDTAAHMSEWLSSPGCNHQNQPRRSKAASVGGLFPSASGPSRHLGAAQLLGRFRREADINLGEGHGT